MLTIQRTRSEVLRLPFLVRLGIVGLVLSGMGDIVTHLGAPVGAVGPHEHTGAQLSAHFAGFVSMVVIQVGVVVDGVRRSRQRRQGPGRRDGR